MMRLLVRLGLVLFALSQLLASCEAWSSYEGRGNGGKYDKENGEQGYPNVNAMVDRALSALEQNTTRRGLGISAWGIVALIVSLIIAGMGFYYFSMCYPAFCIKRDKYGMMGMPNVA
ncbi:hypothetical protein K1T71_002127 [Dendrolimus kikuchii]|uniref:Uncharacterized protein n=1 Tax=Dendrolimus kikuchii TaxID=765133 RepID=A0ACC1DGH2_9NEOP|nr:hypothetical protein K1T71_002127 [Dendrolimus kikuchii]